MIICEGMDDCGIKIRSVVHRSVSRLTDQHSGSDYQIIGQADNVDCDKVDEAISKRLEHPRA